MKQYKADVFIRLFFMLSIMLMKSYQSMVIFIALLQLIAILFDKRPIDSLVIISQHTLSYLLDVMEYLTGIIPIPPFPFSPWKNRYDP